MNVTRAMWDDADEKIWRAAAVDLRALWAADDTRNYRDLAANLGYEGHSKVVNLRTAGRKLRDAAARGDKDAAARIRRAEALGKLIAVAGE